MSGLRRATLLLSLAVLVGAAGCQGLNQLEAQVLRDQALKRLQESGNSGNLLLTMQAIEASVELRLAKAPDVCIQALSSPAAPQRFAGAVGLVELPTAKAEEPLKELLSDPDESVRLAARGALYKLGKRKYGQELIDALGSSDESIRGAALTILGRLGDKAAAPGIRELLEDEQIVRVRLQAAEALVLLGDQDALPTLQRWQYSVNWQERIFAVQLMGQVEPPPDFAPDLLQALNDLNPLVQLQAARSLGRLGHQGGFGKALKYLNPSSGTRRAVAMDRGLSQDDPQFAMVISQIRSLAAQALGEIGRWEAADRLRKALDDEDPQVALAAAYGSLKLLLKTGKAHIETVAGAGP